MRFQLKMDSRNVLTVFSEHWLFYFDFENRHILTELPLEICFNLNVSSSIDQQSFSDF